MTDHNGRRFQIYFIELKCLFFKFKFYSNFLLVFSSIGLGDGLAPNRRL